MIDASHVRLTAADCVSFLGGSLGSDWTASIPDLDFTVTEVVAHAAEACLWYAIDLAAGGKDLDPVEHRVKTDGAPAGRCRHPRWVRSRRRVGHRSLPTDGSRLSPHGHGRRFGFCGDGLRRDAHPQP